LKSLNEHSRAQTLGEEDEEDCRNFEAILKNVESCCFGIWVQGAENQTWPEFVINKQNKEKQF